MEQFCKDNNIEFRKIDKFHSPRASFPSFLFSILNVLSPIIPIQEKDVQDTLKKLEEVKKQISKEDLSENNIAISLAKWISNVPMIYYPSGFQAAAIRFKNSMQENAKMHAISEDVIESCHNGIVPWEKSTNIKPILIRGLDDHEKTKERWEVLKEFLAKEDIDYWEISSIKGNILSKIINLIYQLDYASIYVAILNKIDPSPVKSIAFIKSRLKEQ